MSLDERGTDLLAVGTAIDAYVVKSVLGAGGFGVTYLTEHSRLGKLFAVKEYFPRGYAHRQGTRVMATTSGKRTYEWGLDRFLQEARSLAKFQHRAILTVSDVFEANGTAYMVLAYERGRSLKAWRAELGRAPTQVEVDHLLVDLLDAMAVLHDSSLLHRDIAPDNIYVRHDGTPVLLDFGAARHALGEHGTEMSAIIKMGYSPPEQYVTDARVQGPWSDIYAFGATLYGLVSGTPPPESPVRLIEECCRPAAEVAEGSYRPAFLAAIDHALRLRPNERPQSIAAWRRALLAGGPAATTAPLVAARETSQPSSGRVAPSAERDVASSAPRFANASASAGSASVAGSGTDWRPIGVVAGAAALLVGGLVLTAVALKRQPAPTGGLSCDQLAAIPNAAGGTAKGVQPEAIDTKNAVAECGRALAAATAADRARLQAQLGHALRAAGDFPRAAEMLAAASAAGHAEGMALYGNMLFEGNPPVKVDRAEACRLFQRAMNAGSTMGRAEYAYCLRRGFGGIPRDEKQGVELTRQAAAAGSRDAAVVLGVLYRDGHGVKASTAEAITWLERSAALGEARAHFVLGDIYENGYGIAADRAKGNDHYRRAKAGLEAMAAAHILDARNVLGVMYRDGLGIGRDEPRAAELFRSAADLGSPTGMLRLADMHARGAGVTQDFAKAHALLATAIQRDEDEAMQYLGYLHEEGRGVPQSHAEAMRWYRASADRGNGEAMHSIGNLLDGGHGVKADSGEALRWFRRAAERGNAAAMNSIGVLTESGRGTKQDYVEARRWYLAATGLGNADAMDNLGELHLAGRGTPVNAGEAVRWFLKAAEKGHGSAMYSLGEVYRTGKAGGARFDEALKWLQRAMEKGNTSAMSTLGLMHEEGQGVAKNLTEAARLYRLSADKGNAVGMYNFAVLLEEGRGITRNCKEAESWFAKSAAAGDADAKKKIADGSLKRCK